jgi:hypothetical protein
VTRERVMALKVEFPGANGYTKRMYGSRVVEESEDYVPMLEQVIKDCEKEWAMPPSLSRDQAEAAMSKIFEACRPKRPSQGDGINHLTSQLTKHLQEVKPPSAAAKLTPTEYAKITAGLYALGHPTERPNFPLMSQLGQAKSPLMNAEGGFVSPRLPEEPILQPGRLKCCLDKAGSMVEDETQHIVVENGRQVIKMVPNAEGGGARKKSKTAYEVAHGYVMYFTMVMSVSLLNERAKMHDRLSPVCMERGVFLHPYLVAQFTSFMSRVVGRDVINARGLEEVLCPLLQYAQECVNNPESQDVVWSGDSAVRYVYTEAVKNVALVTVRQHVRDEDEAPSNC